MTGSEDQARQQLITAVSSSYDVAGRVGAGGMGSVYEARDRRHGRRVAIKIIHPELAASVSSARFLLEIQIAARLQHPHILPLFDSGEADGLLYYVTPFVAGESLRQRLTRERQLPLLDVCRITRQVASALTYAHREGVIHRDIKPDNILIVEGEAVVADFGIAKAAAASGESGVTSMGLAVGTPAYMSPEQATADASIDGRADQYSLACVVFEMLAGQPPFVGNSAQVISRQVVEPPPPVRSIRSSVTSAAEAVVHRGLAKIASERFETALEFAEALDSALSGSRSPQTTAAVARRPRGQPAHLGRLVSKTCNRWAQVNGFDSFLRTNRKANPGKPQVFLVHGEEGDAHDSLLDRLVATTLSRFAEDIGGGERGGVTRLRTTWPDTDDLELARRDLAISLFRDADPHYLGDDLSARELSGALSKRLQRVVLVHHDIRPIHWQVFTPDLVDWYVNEFWGSLDTARVEQQFVVFLKLIYPAGRPSALRRVLDGLAGRPDGRRIQRDLEARLTAASRCACMVFRELQPVTIGDVQEWFSSNGIYESEQRRRELAEGIFRTAQSRRMADVEAALEQIHQAYLSEHQFELGSVG
jgi:serine/threonine protein kinase